MTRWFRLLNPDHFPKVARQLVGVLVAIFGIGYLLADRNPAESRNVVLIGLLSKLFGPVLAVVYMLMQ